MHGGRQAGGQTRQIGTLQTLSDLRSSKVPDGTAQIETRYTFGQLRASSRNPNSNTRTRDRLQHDRPAACVSAQQHSSATFKSLRFCVLKNKILALSKSVVISFVIKSHTSETACAGEGLHCNFPLHRRQIYRFWTDTWNVGSLNAELVKLVGFVNKFCRSTVNSLHLSCGNAVGSLAPVHLWARLEHPQPQQLASSQQVLAKW